MDGLSIWQKADTGEIDAVWSYPSHKDEMSKNAQLHGLLRCDRHQREFFFFVRSDEHWIFFLELEKQSHGAAICLKMFSPDFALAALRHFLEVYMKEGDAVSVLKSYLQIFTTGSSKTIDCSLLTDGKANFSLKELVDTFGEAVGQIWAGVVLRKRIALCCSDIALQCRLLTAIAALEPTSPPFNLLRPFSDNSSTESIKGSFIAGFLEPEARTSAAHDLWLDVSSQAVSLNEGNNDIAVSKLPVKVGSLLASHEDGNESEMRAAVQAVFSDVIARVRKIKEGKSAPAGEEAFFTAFAVHHA
mmetsp:Transcript_3420/g.6742  ORF Transcript_3420/g.6742 Transcript_3420/m.6742 type:complete len:302 (-) Transcript_3420:1272-2177(-)